VTRRTPAVVAYALGCFTALVAWVLWAELVHTAGSKGGWSWGVALAVPMALLPTIPFALTLAFAARRGLAVSRPVALAFSAIAGAMTPGVMVLLRYAASVAGVRLRFFEGLFGGLVVIVLLGVAFAAWLAILRSPPVDSTVD
jgi:hypothetical protein